MPTLCFQVLRNARSSKPPFLCSTSAPKYSLCRFLVRPLICTQLHYSALSCACGSLFAKTFRIPSRGIIEFRMYKYHQPWTIWTAGLSVVYVHKRESRVGVISTLGLGNSTHHPGGMWAPSPTATTFVFGPFVARACKKNKTILKRRRPSFERRVAMRIRAAV